MITSLAPPTPIALVTGGSAGLGRALTITLARGGWTVVTDGRSPDRLAGLASPQVLAIAGDVTDADHRERLAAEIDGLGRLDLLVHNASTLGPLPLRLLRDLEDAGLAEAWATNVAAPLALARLVLPALLRAGGAILSITSDAAVEHYPTWGAYGASKAALEHLTLTLAAEEDLSGYAVDPGDMRTQMQADAFPGEDLSDRALPEDVVVHLLALVRRRPPSGRYRASDVEVSTVECSAVEAAAREGQRR